MDKSNTLSIMYVDRVLTDVISPLTSHLAWLSNFDNDEDIKSRAIEKILELFKNVGISEYEAAGVAPEDAYVMFLAKYLIKRELDLDYDYYLVKEDIDLIPEHIVTTAIFDMLFTSGITGKNPITVVYTSNFDKGVFEVMCSSRRIPETAYTLISEDELKDYMKDIDKYYGVEVGVSGRKNIETVYNLLADKSNMKYRTIHLPIFGGDDFGDDFQTEIEKMEAGGVAVMMIPNLQFPKEETDKEDK